MRNEQEIRVVLVDADGTPTGETMEKAMAHRCGALHAAFTVVYMTPEGLILTQVRGEGAQHSAGRIAPSVCSHPREGEAILDAARRRIKEELGIWWEHDLEEVFTVRYCLDVQGPRGEHLIEHEFDHIVLVRCRTTIKTENADRRQIQKLDWVSTLRLLRMMEEEPDALAPWYPPIMREFVRHGIWGGVADGRTVDSSPREEGI